MAFVMVRVARRNGIAIQRPLLRMKLRADRCIQGNVMAMITPLYFDSYYPKLAAIGIWFTAKSLSLGWLRQALRTGGGECVSARARILVACTWIKITALQS
ncbi:hypothetical protein TW80_09675 [Loktanella sp. S4079]|nr:hypothetical protein TW80_09675 [Loktanella sp. S4079]